jgi:hypothetical protein
MTLSVCVVPLSLRLVFMGGYEADLVSVIPSNLMMVAFISVT